MSAAVASILASIGQIGLQLGLPELIDFVDKSIAEKAGMNYTALSNKLNKILVDAKTKIGPKYEELVYRLNNIPGLSGSTAFDKVIRNAKRQLSQDISKLSDLNSKASNMANNLEQQMVQFSYLPASYKASKQGRTELKSIMDQGKQLDTLVERTLKGVNSNGTQELHKT